MLELSTEAGLHVFAIVILSMIIFADGRGSRKRVAYLATLGVVLNAYMLFFPLCTPTFCKNVILAS